MTAAATVLAVAIAATAPWRGRVDDDRARVPLDPVPASSYVLPSNWTAKVIPQLERRSLSLDREELARVLDAVEENARRFHVNPLMILAVIHVESRFDPFAISPAGARGLMQLRPETAQAVAADIGAPWTSEEMLFDPEYNVLLGTGYLKQLLDRFGDLDAALAAFNSGPTRISVRHKRIGAVPLAYPDRVWDVLVDLQASAQTGPRGSGRIS